MVTYFFKFLFSVIAVALLVIHVAQPSIQVDVISLGLLVAAALPWASYFIESAEFPGGYKIAFRTLQATVKKQEQKIESQQELINNLVKYSISASIFHHLCGIALLYEYYYRNNEAMRREMYFLRDNGFIQPKEGQSFLDFDDKLDGKNLVEISEPTPIGLDCVVLRKAETPQNMLEARHSTNLRINPSSFGQ